MPGFPGITSQNFDEAVNSLWPDDFDSEFSPQQNYSLSLLDNSVPDLSLPNPRDERNKVVPCVQQPDVSHINNEPYTIVHDKRRGKCRKCQSECLFYRGEGGPCNECGCFPSQHVDLDNNNNNNKKRTRWQSEDEDENDELPRKRPRYLLETKFYQKLFFNCLHFMTLEEISAVCSRAPVPIFVKDESSVYIYINTTFCAFIMDISRTERILHKTTSQVLGQSEALDVVKQEKFLMTHDQGTLKTFNVNIHKQTYRVMKQWTVLRDGKKVIVGAVVSSF